MLRALGTIGKTLAPEDELKRGKKKTSILMRRRKDQYKSALTPTTKGGRGVGGSLVRGRATQSPYFVFFT